MRIDKLTRYVLRLLWGVLFLLALGFAVKNSQGVVVSYYFGYQWETPLALALLVCFVAGVAAGVAAGLSMVFRQKREILSLKRELRARAADDAVRRQED